MRKQLAVLFLFVRSSILWMLLLFLLLAAAEIGWFSVLLRGLPNFSGAVDETQAYELQQPDHYTPAYSVHRDEYQCRQDESYHCGDYIRHQSLSSFSRSTTLRAISSAMTSSISQPSTTS